jgi:hypothetical protein
MHFDLNEIDDLILNLIDIRYYFFLCLQISLKVAQIISCDDYKGNFHFHYWDASKVPNIAQYHQIYKDHRHETLDN